MVSDTKINEDIDMKQIAIYITGANGVGKDTYAKILTEEIVNRGLPCSLVRVSERAKDELSKKLQVGRHLMEDHVFKDAQIEYSRGRGLAKYKTVRDILAEMVSAMPVEERMKHINARCVIVPDVRRREEVEYLRQNYEFLVCFSLGGPDGAYRDAPPSRAKIGAAASLVKSVVFTAGKKYAMTVYLSSGDPHHYFLDNN